MSKSKCVWFILGGIVAIVVGGEVVVDCAKSLALAVGMSETLVGLTVEQWEHLYLSLLHQPLLRKKEKQIWRGKCSWL